MRSGLPVLCLALALLGLAACTKRVTPVEEGIRTHTLLLGNGSEPADLDPHVIAAYTDQNIQLALFEGLTGYDEATAQAVPAAAERWETSADGLTWTFHLRPNLAWSNGDPLTAGDFVQSWRRALTPAVACPNAYLFSPVKNADAFSSGQLTDRAALGFTAPDARTVVITLAQPTPILPLYTALPCWHPVNPRVLAGFDGLAKRAPAWTRPGNLVGNGPFTLAEWTPNARIVVVKSPRYWDAANNRLERIIFFPIDNTDAEERDFRAGQLHLTGSLPTAKIASYKARASSPLRTDPFLQVIYVNFNHAKPPLDQAKVRRALSLAIDREAIARAVYNGSAKPALSFVPNPCGPYVPRTRVGTDFAEARRLLAAAGYPGGRGLPVFPMQVLNGGQWPRAAEALQAMWKKELGVEISIEALEQKTWIQNQQSKTHTIGLMGWIADFADPVSFLGTFASDSGNNWTGWANADYDRLLKTAAIAPEATARLEAFQNAESLLLGDEAALAPLIFAAKSYLIHPAVKNWAPAPLGLHRYQLIRLEP
jgi:oligopeptide transport system substrate-binding protein